MNYSNETIFFFLNKFNICDKIFNKTDKQMKKLITFINDKSSIREKARLAVT